jgi:hypothetical protein
MTCTWQEEQAYRFAEGSLDAETKEAFAAHLPGCDLCRERTAGVRHVGSLLGAALVPVSAPPDLAGRVAQAVALERTARRRPWPRLLHRRALSLASTSLLLAVALLVVAAGPESVMAVVQKALFFVPGFGIKAVDQDTLVSLAPASVREGNVTFTVEALLADGQRTVLKYNVSGLPGGKAGWQEGQGPGEQATAEARPARLPLLRDQSGQEYTPITSTQSVGGSAAENRVSGEIYYPALSGQAGEVTLVMPVDYIAPAAVLPGGDRREWQIKLTLAHPEAGGLALATPQAVAATARGVTLRVTAVVAEPTRTAVLLEGSEGVMGLGANGDDILGATVLRDSKGRVYKRLSDRLEASFGSQDLRQTLYFEPLAADAGQLTLTVADVRVKEEATADWAVALAGHRPGETWSLGQQLRLGSHEILLRSATLADGTEPGLDAGWLYLAVDLGPTVEGRQFSAFSIDLSGGTRASMGSMGGPGNSQLDRVGVALAPGQTEVRVRFSQPVVNVQGPWVLTFRAAE